MIKVTKKKLNPNGKSNREKMLEAAAAVRAEKDFKPLSRAEIRKEVVKRRTGNFDD
jgi:hypothetical protein